MNLWSLQSIVAALLFATLPAPADTLFYKGTSREVYAGEGHDLRVGFKMTLLVDFDTCNIALVEYGVVNGRKVYSASTITNLQYLEVSAANNKSVVALGRPPTDCDIAAGATSSSVFAEGPKGPVAIGDGLFLQFARTLQYQGRSVRRSDSGQFIHRDASFTVGFDKKATIESHASGETLEDAYGRLLKSVEAQGYSKASLSRQPLWSVDQGRSVEPIK